MPNNQPTKARASYRATPPPQHHVLDDILKVKLSRVSNLYRAAKESTNQRVGIVQDVMNISLATLGGAISLRIFANQTIKTHLLFHFAVAGLLFCLVAALVIRIVIANAWANTLSSLADEEESLRLGVGNVKYHDTDHHTDAMDDLNSLIESEPDTPNLPWPASMKAITILGTVFILSLVSIATSLLFKISID